MKVIIVDDEQIAIDVLEILLNQIDGIEIVGKYKEPRQALEKMIDIQVDVVFLDMEMGELHGLEFAEILSRNYPLLEIIFVTAHPEFALDAFEVNAIDYLLKPVDQKRLSKTMDKLQRRLLSHEYDSIVMEIKDTHLSAQVMGSLQIFDHVGNEMKWRTKKTKELFIYLWHHKGIGVNRSQIIIDLWPQLYEDKAIAILHTTIYQLRKAMREIGFENPIILINERYILNIPVESDLDELKNILTSSEINSLLVERVSKLYRGEYLEVGEYEWALPRQEKIRGLFLGYLENYVLNVKQRTGKEGNIAENCLKRMLQLAPYKIQYIYLLLEFYGETKNIQMMMSLLQESKEKWKNELGLDLPKEFEELYSKYIKYE